MIVTLDEYVLRVFISIYILWGVLWAMVAYHYGRASYSTWRQQGGLWANSFSDLMRPYLHGWLRFLCWIKVLKSEDFCDRELPSRYTIGHYLRFSIFLGALSPGLMTLAFVTNDREGWSVTSLAIGCVIFFVSVLGAIGHLFIAYRLIPSGWTRVTILSTFWLFAAPILLIYTNWP